jgi:hypothetical protein
MLGFNIGGMGAKGPELPQQLRRLIDLAQD